jgi:transposase
MEVNRRQRRAKTDRMDVEKLLRKLIRYRSGEQEIWSVVNVPSVEEVDRRHMHRELSTLKKDRTRHINRIKGFLVGQGIRVAVKRNFLQHLERVQTWDGMPISPSLRERLTREFERLQFVEKQIKVLERQ